jgi:predicted AlkP superfamily phosphohydrolase/phosphomutase
MHGRRPPVSKTRRIVLAALAAGAFSLGGPGWGCRRAAQPAPLTKAPVSVLLIGLDGASWTFIEPLRARGVLPNLDRLIREGVRAPMRTLSPSLSPALWTTMATGRPPEVHGIADFQSKDETGQSHIVSSDARKTEALWTIVSRSGRRVGFVGWWVTWPAEPVEGYLVSDHFLRPNQELLTRATYPERLAAELNAAIREDWPWLRQSLENGQLKTLSDRSPRGPQGAPQRLEEARRLYDQDHRGEQAILHLLSREPLPDLVGFTSRKIDLASHYMWAFAPDQGVEAVSRVLEPVYRYEDDLIGRLVAAAGPATHVLVVSDHGFERVASGYDHKEGAPDGIFVAWGPSFRHGATLDAVSLVDIAPTVLHLLGLPVAKDMEGRVADGAFADAKPVKWIATYETGRRAARGSDSPVDDELREQLRSLGYIK